MSLDQALTLARRRRPEVEPIPAFIRQLQSYEERCRSLGLLKDEDESKGAQREKGLDADGTDGKGVHSGVIDDKLDHINATIVSQDGPGTTESEPSIMEKNPFATPTAKRVVGPSRPPSTSSDASSKRSMIGPSPPPSTLSGAKKARIGPQREH